MKSGKENKPRGNIHRQQLFYWMGRSLDDANRGRKVLRDDVIATLLTQLRGSLENGIWVKRPRIPEELSCNGATFPLALPIACFTEWSLGDSLPHTAEYGRVGFGFPKRWVIDRGGQSVSYFRHDQKGGFLRSAFQLLDTLGARDAAGAWHAKTEAARPAFAALVYLLHFAKMIRLKKSSAATATPAPPPPPKATPPRLKAAVRPPAALDAQAFSRRFGHPLQFVEEREWRIVHHPAHKGFKPGRGGPDFFLPYLPGDELFTLILPDNKVVSRVLQEDWFTTRLFTPWKAYPQLAGRRVPPVTVLAHSDIGTF